MPDLSARLFPRHYSRLAAGAVVAALCLAGTGCSPVSAASGAASSTAPSPADSGASGLKLSNAPGLSSAFGSTPVPRSTADAGPPADPFAGTPADSWSDGADGIVLPAAKPIGVFSRDQVKLAYQWTRKLLVAANLNTATLLGGAPSAFTRLLTQQDRTWFLAGLNKKGVDKRGAALSTRTMVMSFAPGKARLIGDVIKVHGTMHARAALDKGGYHVLDVDVDYAFVYAIEPPGTPASWTRVINEVGWTLSFGDWAEAATTFEPALSTSGIGGVSGVLCGTTDGYEYPDYPSAEAQPSDTPSGTPVDPYVLGQQSGTGCHPATRT